MPHQMDARVFALKARPDISADLLSWISLICQQAVVPGPHCQYNTIPCRAKYLLIIFYSWTLGDDWPNQGEIDIIEGMKIFSISL